MLRSLGGHFCDVENSEAFVCDLVCLLIIFFRREAVEFLKQKRVCL